jgi:predicted negative regulator of RcsB-dependent stress response
MKATERHQLKQNEFATGAAHVMTDITQHSGRWLVMGGIVVLILIVGGGVTYWRNHTADQAGAMLGVAMATTQSPIAPPSSLPGAKQQAGTFSSEKARSEAALAAFQQVAAAYPSTPSGLAAAYHAAAELAVLGRASDAEAAYKAVADKAGSSIYGPMARIGQAQVLVASGKVDDGIKLLTDLAAQRDGVLPVDGVLMQLASACVKAGKTQEARAAYKRVTDEFPQSPYAASAKEQSAALK